MKLGDKVIVHDGSLVKYEAEIIEITRYRVKISYKIKSGYIKIWKNKADIEVLND